MKYFTKAKSVVNSLPMDSLIFWLALLVISVLPFLASSHRCVHDEVSSEPLKLSTRIYNDDSTLNGREKRNVQTPKRIRIETVLMANVSEIPSVLASNGTLSAAIELISEALSVQLSNERLLFTPPCVDETTNSTLCEEGANCICTNLTTLQCGPYVTVPNDHIGVRSVCDGNGPCSLQGPNGTGLADVDFVLYVTALSDGCQFGEPTAGGLFPGFGEFGSYCIIDPTQSNRPVAGWINFCPFMFQGEQPGQRVGPVIQTPNVKDSIVHQLVHMLGFSRNLFPYFDNDGAPVLGSEVHDTRELPAVVTPKVVEVARQHFGCPYINGVYLFGDHWETWLLQPEVMASTLYPIHTYLSEFTLALFEDSGWYKANYTVTQRTIGGQKMPFLYGKNLGCSFVYERCGGFGNPYSCGDNSAGCSYDGRYRGICIRVPGLTSCDVLFPSTTCEEASSINLQQGIFEGPSNQSDSGTALEMFGNRSFCFVSRLTPNSSISRGPRCYGVEPVTDGNNYAYSIMTNATVGSHPTLGCVSSGTNIFVVPAHNVSGEITCAHQEIVEFLHPPGAASSELQTPFCHRTCGSCTKINNPNTCLQCSVPNVSPDGPTPTTCSLAMNFALVNGSQSENGNLYSGRLQIVNSDVPGLVETICSNTWTENLAQITCNIVGYATVVNAYAGQGGIFGAGQGEIFDRFECQQFDARFNSVITTNCSVRSKNNTCDHSMDAGAECSGRKLRFSEMIGYPFNSSNGYGVITGCRSCSLLGLNQHLQQSSPNCSKSCEKVVMTPYPLTLFGRSENFTSIRVGTYGGVQFEDTSSFPPVVVEFTPYAEDFDTVYKGSVFYKSVVRQQKNQDIFKAIDRVIADSFVTPSSFSFVATYALIVTWTDVTICCTPKPEQNSFQAIIASNGLFTFGIATYPQNGLQTLERFGGSWIARYDKQEQLYGFGKLIFDTLVIPTNTKNYGQVVVRIDSKQPIPLDVDQDGISDAEDPCVGCCVSEFFQGVEWPMTVQGGKVDMPCSVLNPSFSAGSVYSRTCISNTKWTSVDLSSCTFNTGATNPILTHRVRAFNLGMNVTIDDFVNEYNLILTAFGITNVTVTNLGDIQNVSSNAHIGTLVLEFLLGTFDEVLADAFIRSLQQEQPQKRGVPVQFETIEAVGFLPSENCTCTNMTSQAFFTSVCSGAPQDPCQCTQDGCQCSDPYVPLQAVDSSNLTCALDSDGDGIADVNDNCPELFSIDNTCPSPQTLVGVTCPREVDPEWGFMWNRTSAGSTAGQRCQMLGGGPMVTGFVTRACGMSGVWGMVNTNLCQSRVISEVRDEIVRLDNLGRPLAEVEQQRIEELTLELANATSSNASVLFPADLQSVNVYVDTVASLIEDGEVPPNNVVNIMTILNVTSNVLDERFQNGWLNLNSESSANGASQLLLNVERIGSIIARMVLTPGQGNVPEIQLPNIILDVMIVDTRMATSEVTIGGKQLTGSNLQPAELPSVTLPRDVLADLGLSPLIPVTTIVFRNMDAILPRRLNNGFQFPVTQSQPGSRVVSTQVGTSSTTPRSLNGTITLQFPLILQGAINPQCVFWSFNDTQNFVTDGWSSEGLRVGAFDESSGTVTCISNHLTSFAVLVDVSGQQPPSLPLSILTYIGCGISIICLVLTVIFLLTMRRDLYQKVNNFVLLNLCIALICGLITFCAGIETAAWHVISCSIVAALLHYFFLAGFSWMLCEAVLIYNLLVKVFGAHERKWLYIFLGIGWGFPIPILIITLASRYNYYFIRGSLDASSPQYHDIRACWLSSQEGVIFAFVAPMVAILIINTCLLIRAMYSLWKSDLGSSAQKISEKEAKASKEIAVKLMKATVILMPLLGLTWVFGLLAAIPFPQPGQLILAAFFLVLNTLQGAFIFFFHVVRHDRVWPKLKKLCSCIKIKKEQSSATASTSNGTKSTKTTSTIGHSAKRSYTLPSSGDTSNHYSTRESVAMESFASPDIYKIDDDKNVTLNNPVVDAFSVQGFELEFLEDWERTATVRR